MSCMKHPRRQRLRYKEIETIFTEINRSTYFNMKININFNSNFKIETNSAINNLA
jgi:hypothetical protein